MDYAKESLRLHGEWKGKIEVVATVPANDKESLSLAYTPGVAQPCLEIQKHPEKSYELTRRHNLVAVITDGTAVLGLGDIGPEAGMPVMEGKCVLFKRFADVDAFPLCVKTKDVDEFVQTVYNISGSFGGINLEDIAAPRCFEIERKLKEKCDIPVFHDDQHGTAIIALAGLTNALKVVGKKKEDVKVVFSGAGSAAISITKLLLQAGFQDITLCDKFGALYEGNPEMNWAQQEIAKVTNRENGRHDGRGRRVHRRVRPQPGHPRHGADHEQGRHRLRLRQPHPGDLPRRRQGGRSPGSGHRPQRLPQPDQQRAGLPGHLPGRPGRAGQRHQRGDEDGRRPGPGRRHPRRGALRGQHHPQALRPPRGPRRGPGRGRGRPKDRRRPQAFLKESLAKNFLQNFVLPLCRRKKCLRSSYVPHKRWIV